MRVGDRVEIRRKGSLRHAGVVTAYEADDGFIGNPEKWIRVAIGNAEYRFRGSTRDDLWRGTSKTMRKIGEVRITEARR